MSKCVKASCIIAAAGQSSRFGAENKILAEVMGKPVIAYTAEALSKSEYIGEIIIVAREEDILYISDIVKQYDIKKVKTIVRGGASRSESVSLGLKETSDEFSLVAIHDGARPCVTEEIIKDAVEKAYETGAAAPGVAVTDTIKKSDENGVILHTVDRKNLWRIQTPQVFKKEIIKKAYEKSPDLTDDCAAVELLGHSVYITSGSELNLKITTKSDMFFATAILSKKG